MSRRVTLYFIQLFLWIWKNKTPIQKIDKLLLKKLGMGLYTLAVINETTTTEE